MKYLFLLFSLISFNALSQSQITDTIKTNHDTLKFKSQIAISGYWNRTNNSNTSLYTFKTNNSLTSRKKIIFLETSFTYGTQNRTILTNDDYNVTGNINFRRDKTFYYWTSIQYDDSYSLNIKFRIQTGGGIGFFLFKTDKFYINISDGLIYEYKNFNNYRNSARLKIFIKNKDISFESSTYLQPSILYNNDYVLKSTNTLSLNLKKWLTIQFNYTENFISTSEKRNTLSTVGTNFKF